MELRWTLAVSILLSLTSAPPAQASVVSSTSLADARVTYDEARGRLVFTRASRDVWECDGQHWSKAPVQLPSAATWSLYDAWRQRVFLVCGGTLYGYDGHRLSDHGSAPYGLVIVADLRRHRLVGLRSPGFYTTGTTVEWDGTNWQQVATLPAQRVLTGLAYDERRHVTVAQLMTLLPVLGNETLEWDGTAWTLRDASLTLRGMLAYDPVRGQILSTWNGLMSAWDGTSWTALPATTMPAVNTPGGASVATDRQHGRVWLFRGALNTRSEIWSWNGTYWSQPLIPPHPELAGQLTFDSARGRAVLLGCTSVPGTVAGNAHYEWDGFRWFDRTLPGVLTSPFWGHAQVHDAGRGETLVFGGSETVVFGGSTSYVFFGETWAWNGSSWRLAATSGPAPRSRAAMTFDTGRGRVVLFGGVATGSPFQDHWEWDGTSWTLVAATTPMGAVLGTLGHDPVRARTVLVDTLGRTWEHDGAAWSLASAASPMPTASATPLAWDAQRQRVQGFLRNAVNATHRYEWDGAQWTQLGTGAGELAFDTVRGAMLHYEPSALRTLTTTPAAAADVGTPCGGTTTPTSLTAFGRARPGDPGFHLDVRAEATQRPATIGFGLGTASTPLGNGCTAYIQNPFGAVAWFTDTHGFWHHPMPLPNVLALRGVTFTAQAAVLDPASPGALAVSQGLAVTIGD